MSEELDEAQYQRNFFKKELNQFKQKYFMKVKEVET